MARNNFNPIYPIAGGLVGALAGNLIGTISDLNDEKRLGDKRVALVQKYNRELFGQLSDSYEVDDLSLNDESKSYVFTSSPEGLEPMTCRGEYTVEDDIAHAVGTIACTTEQTIEK